jgi:predicted Zn-dependent protease
MENKNKRTSIIIFWIVGVLIVAFFTWHFFVNKPVSNQNPVQNSTTASTTTNSIATTTTTTSSSNQTNVGGVVITQPQAQKTSLPEPSLSMSTIDTSKLDQNMVATAEVNMQVTVANLQKDKTSFHDWIDLGVERKTVGDYAGAALDWEYASALYPQNAVSFGNLGDLYTNFLHDNTKAEVNYKLGIQSTPTNVDLYRNLFNLYISEGKNTEAVALLKSGITATPKNYDLDLLLARYYSSHTDSASAKVYYDQAIVIAQSQGNTQMVQAFQTEEEAELK